MSTPYRHVPEELHVICRKCGAANGAHSLHCPTLRLPEGWTASNDEEMDR